MGVYRWMQSTILSDRLGRILALLNQSGRDRHVYTDHLQGSERALRPRPRLPRFKADYAVIGASFIDGDGAVPDYDARDVSVARAILRNARARILVADAAKFDRTASVRISDIGDVDYFVSDKPPPAAFRRAAKTGETRSVIADGGRDGMRDAV